MKLQISPRTGGPSGRCVIQLIPHGTGGVRDHADGLSREWLTQGLESHTIALAEADVRQQSLVNRLEEIIAQRDGGCSVVLHFSGYGFERRGLCFWLVREIESARRVLRDKVRWATMFHELFASGPPWGSAFWLSGAQSWIATRVARASDVVWTNTQLHSRWLRSQVNATVQVEVHPVFSNIGEPADVGPIQGREPRLLVFGSPATRSRALARLSGRAAWLQSQGITEVLEVGSGAATPAIQGPLVHRFTGRMEACELSALLKSSRYGLLDYCPSYLGKSGVFAAYLAHGCVAFNCADVDPDADGLQHDHQYVLLQASGWRAPNMESLQAIADAGRAWYLEHSLTTQAKALAHAMEVTCLQGMGPVGASARRTPIE